MDKQQRIDKARHAAQVSWEKTDDRAARTAPARAALLERFERQVDPTGILTPSRRRELAEHARSQHYRDMAYKSAAARRANRDRGQ